MTGRLLLRKRLAQELEIKPDEVRFVKNEYGKLFLHPVHQASGLYFNLSHTERMVVGMFAPWKTVGIDVERVGRDHLGVMPTAFIQPEIDYVEGRPTPSLRREAFYLIWTRKEAVMKAVGLGFSLPPRSFSVPFSRAQEENDAYLFYTYSLPPDYLCSLAFAKEEVDKAPLCRLQQVDFLSLYG